jgi:GntR family galactonate operon transcriptional repressor
MTKEIGPAALLGHRRSHSLFTHVVASIGSRVVQETWKLGDVLPTEADLCVEFGASRSVVREAVKSLAAKGLVESKTRTGLAVLPRDRWNLFDPDVLEWRYAGMHPRDFFAELFEIRLMIEPSAAALAADRATGEELESISEALEMMCDERAPLSDLITSDLLFHRRILSAAHNSMLLQMGNVVAVGLLTSYKLAKKANPFNVFLDEHKRVENYIRGRKRQDAQRAMTDLLEGTRDYFGIKIKI